MTALCSGGTSSGKPNLNAIVGVSATAVESAIILAGFPSVAAALAPIITGISLDLTSFCGTDPPADPGLTGQDLIDVLNFADPTVSIPALLKFRQWFQRIYWCQICKCDNGVTPVCTPHSNPGSISSNPGVPVATSACFSGSANDAFTGASGSVTVHNMTGHLLPVGSGSNVVLNSVPIGSLVVNGVTFFPIPPGVTAADFHATTVSIDPNQGASAHATTAFLTGQASGVTSSSAIANPPLQPNLDTHFIPVGFGAWDPSDTHWAVARALGARSSPAADETVAVNSNISCSGNPLGQSCCPPDPLIDQKLNQLAGMLQAIIAGSPAPINSYADATAHAGLTGSGTVTLVDDALAIRVDITTDPASLGVVPGSPAFLFDRGWIVPVVNAAPISGITSLVFNPQFYPLPLLTEQIGFTLHPGVVITITELVRGP